MSVGQILGDIRKLLVTAAIALISGYGFSLLGLPVPYMLGSLIGVWFVGGAIRPIQPHLGIARWFHIPVIVGLGVIVGGAIGPGFFENIRTWWATSLVVIAATAIATTVGYVSLRYGRKRPWLQALLSAVPGGQAEVSVIARDYVEKDYAVVLSHLVRVTFIFLSTPLILALTQGEGSVEASYEVQENLPRLRELSPLQLLTFLGLAAVSYGLALVIRMPMPHLLGPFFLTFIVTAFGWVEVIRLSEFVLLAQITIAGQIGSRLAKVPFGEVVEYLIDGLIVAVGTLSIYTLGAWAVAVATGTAFISVYLGFVPGGLYEVTLLSVLFGLDVAFVAFHNTFRVILIYVALPPVLAKTKLKSSSD